MKLTNKYNYPPAYCKATELQIFKPSKENRFRVTELIGPPLIRTLLREKWDDIEIDVADMSNILIGCAVHNYFGQYEADNIITKKKLLVKFDSYEVSGESDNFYLIKNTNAGIITDYKFTSVWSFVFGRPEWEDQLNCYAYLWRKYKYDIVALHIAAFLKDWSAFELQRSKNNEYPDKPFYLVNLPLWTTEQQENFIQNKLDDHIKNPMRECTPAEKWEKPTTYAIMKEGRKTALRVLDNETNCSKFIAEKKLGKDFDAGNIFIEKRQGSCVRCERYCSVKNVCPYVK